MFHEKTLSVLMNYSDVIVLDAQVWINRNTNQNMLWQHIILEVPFVCFFLLNSILPAWDTCGPHAWTLIWFLFFFFLKNR